MVSGHDKLKNKTELLCLPRPRMYDISLQAVNLTRVELRKLSGTAFVMIKIPCYNQSSIISPKYWISVRHLKSHATIVSITQSVLIFWCVALLTEAISQSFAIRFFQFSILLFTPSFFITIQSSFRETFIPSFSRHVFFSLIFLCCMNNWFVTRSSHTYWAVCFFSAPISVKDSECFKKIVKHTSGHRKIRFY